MTFHHHHRMDGCDWCEGRENLLGAFLLGVGVLALGVTLILDNFQVIDASVLAPYWPVLLVVLGVSHLVGPASARRVGWGLSWSAIGAIILLHNLDLAAFGTEVMVASILVVLGANLLLCGFRRRSHGSNTGAGRRSASIV
jgi:hypothetical protein